ncbi:MAG: MFS transporter [Acidimicrobiales bacterium]|jgi:MFS family permease
MANSKWFAPLRERNFRLFFIGQTASQIGSGMAPVAIVFAVLAHGTAVDVGYVLAAETIPLVILLLVGGVVADRMSRRSLMLRADILRTAAEAALGVWVLVGRPPLWGFMTLAALMGVGQAFFMPALTGIVPQMLGNDVLQEGNALYGISASSGGIVGPAIAGVIVAVSSPGWAILADSLTYLLSVISLGLIRIDWSATEHSESFIALLRQGWDAFWSRTWLWVIVVEFSLANAFFASFLVLGPVVAKHHLGGAPAWGTILAAQGVGSVVGGIVMLRFHPRRPLLIATLATLVFPLPLFLVADHSPTYVISLFALLAGASVSVFSVLWSTTMQREVPPELLSRVSAYDWFGSLALMPIWMALVGPVATRIGTSRTLELSGIVMIALVCVALLVPSVTQLRAPAKSA